MGKFVGYQKCRYWVEEFTYSHFWRLLQTLVAMLDFQISCVTGIRATRRLTRFFYCNCNDSTNVIIVIPKANLLVNTITKSESTDR
jgi:precorrin-2 methylase